MYCLFAHTISLPVCIHIHNQLSLHPRFVESETCKQVTLTRSGDDLVMQLSPKLYSQSTPTKRPALALHLEWVRGSGTLPYGPSRDLPEPVDPAKPKVSRIAQRKEILAKFREENKVLKAEKRDRVSEMRRLKSENEVLKRESLQLRESQASHVKASKQQQPRSEVDALRRENQQLRQARDGQHAHLLRIGSANEFQRQHIEHLRRSIVALQQQVVQLGGEAQPEQGTDANGAQEVVVVDDSDEQQQSKRRRVSEG